MSTMIGWNVRARLLPIAVTMIVVASLAQFAAAQEAESQQRRILSVSGRAEVAVPVTHANLEVSTETRNESPGAAQRAAAEIITQVLEFLRATPDVERLQTNAVVLRPELHPGTRVVVAYTATVGVNFRIPVGQVGAVVDGAVERGASRLRVINFSATDAAIEEARLNAIELAGRQAQNRAEKAREVFGLESDELLRIRIDTGDVGRVPSTFTFDLAGERQGRELGTAASQSAIEAGEQRISVTVVLEIGY